MHGSVNVSNCVTDFWRFSSEKLNLNYAILYGSSMIITISYWQLYKHYLLYGPLSIGRLRTSAEFLQIASLIHNSSFFPRLDTETWNPTEEESLFYSQHVKDWIHDSREVSCTTVMRKFTVLFDSKSIVILHTINSLNIFPSMSEIL